jgi:hypothetical protein
VNTGGGPAGVGTVRGAIVFGDRIHGEGGESGLLSSNAAGD